MLSPGMRRFYIYLLMFLVIVVFLSIPLVVPYLSRSSDFSVFNSDWNGTSSFYKNYMENAELKRLEMEEDRFLNTFMGDLSDIYIEDPSNTVMITLGPSVSYSSDEKEFLKRFLEEGGTLLIADDFGTGNEILEGVGIEARFSNHLVLDSVFQTSGLFPIIYKGPELSEYNLLLNYPSSIIGAEEQIFRTTEMAFLDLDGDHSYDIGEPRGPFTMVAKIENGMGDVYLFSDPSIFINSMIDQLDNREYIFDMMEDLTENFTKTVYIDEAHLGTLEDIDRFNIVVTITDKPFFRYILISFIALVFIIESHFLMHMWSVFTMIINRFKFGQETSLKAVNRKELIDSLNEMHPEWHKAGLNSFFSKFR